MNLLRRLDKDKKYYVAFSGGVDSVVLTHYLLQKGYNIILLNIDHLNDWSKIEKDFTIKFGVKYNLPCRLFSINRQPITGESKEAIWSKEREAIFQQLEYNVLTGHHLDDAVEWYVMTTLGQGKSYLLNYQNENIFRPLLLVKKEDIIEYAVKHNLDYLVDPSNLEDNALRNKVRLKLLPEITQVFPGIRKVVRKLILNKEQKYVQWVNKIP